MPLNYCSVSVVQPMSPKGGVGPLYFGVMLELASKAKWQMTSCSQGDWNYSFDMPDRLGWDEADGQVWAIISSHIPDARITVECQDHEGNEWIVYAHKGKTEIFDEQTYPPPTLWAEPQPEALALDRRERATMLAALRYWQRVATLMAPESQIATDDGAITELSGYEIDALCQRINTGGQ